MPKEHGPGKPTTRRYGQEEKDAAVRMVRTLRAGLGVEHGTVQRVAKQLGYGVESVRSWVKQADIDAGVKPGVSSEAGDRIAALEQENRELRRANEIPRGWAGRSGARATFQVACSVPGSPAHSALPTHSALPSTPTSSSSRPEADATGLQPAYCHPCPIV